MATKKAAKPALSFKLMMHTTPVQYKRLFAVAAQKWPGIGLGYVGTSEAGDHYMQQWGNSSPFIVSAAELN